MDKETNASQEASPSDDDQLDEKVLNTAYLETKIKIETPQSGNELEMYTKTNVKEDANVNLQNEHCFSKYVKRDVKYEISMSNCDFEMDSKISIKEEAILPDTELPQVAYLDCTSVTINLKNDTMTGNAGTYIFSERDVEAVSKTEIDFRSKVPALPNISQANGNKECQSLTFEDLSPLASPRLIPEVVHLDRNSYNFPEASEVRTSSIDKETSKRLCNPACATSHFESLDNVHDGNIQEYTCEICAKNFQSLLKLKQHSLCHSRQKSNKCETCGKCFTQRSGLKTHSLLHLGTKPYKCSYCQKCFTQNAHLKSHTLIHSGTKTFKCEICKMSFTHKSSLMTHIVLHTGRKPFKCDLCDKHFTRRSHLKTHTLRHAITKPFKCEHCDKCFTQESSLNRHILLHKGSKPYKCDHCEKCFTQKTHLSRHMLVHSGSKPYKCEQCDKCFIQKYDLKRHSLVHLHKIR